MNFSTDPPQWRLRRRQLGGICLLSIACWIPLVQSAVAPVPREFNIPAGEAETTLRMFMTQADIELVYAIDVIEGVRTHAVQGKFPAREALDRMIRNTGMTVVEDAISGALMIRRAPAPASARSPPPLVAGASHDTVKRENPVTRLARWLTQAVAPLRPEPADQRVAVATDDPIVLSPFEVSADEDKGYQATSTLAGTHLRSELKDLSASISVVTRDFMRDVHATDLTSLLIYTLGTEVGGYGGNFTDLSNPEAGGVFNDALGQSTPGTRVRGLIGADRTRDYFLTDLPMDTYNIERVEISRGASPILFGLGSPAGIINSSLIKASLGRDSTRVEASFGSYGTHRGTLDHNRRLLSDQLALRMAAVYDETKYRPMFTFSRKKAVTLTGTYQPFAHTVIRATSEIGRADSNRPQIRPPVDKFSWWWAAGRPVWNPATGTGRLLGEPQSPFSLPGTGTTAVFDAAGGRVENYLTFNWDGLSPNVPGLFYQDPNSSRLGGIDIGGGRRVDGIKGFADNAILNTDGSALVAGGMVGLNGWPVLMAGVYLAGDPLAPLYTKDPMINNPGLFDFYHQVLEGPTKYQWSWWDAHNVTLEHTFLGGRAGLAASFDRQQLDDGFTSPTPYRLNLDVNEVLPNGAPNPNFLRPIVIGNGFKRVYSRDREALRFTGFYHLDLRQAPGPRWLGRLLGRHMLNANHSRQDSFYQKYGGTMWSNDLDWRIYEGQPLPGITSSTARIVPVAHYVGPSILGTADPGDVRIQGLTAPQDPSGVATMTILTHQRTADSSPHALRPWTPETFGLISNGRYDVRNTVRNAQSYSERTSLKVRSLSFSLQSHWLQDTVVTTAGWRTDRVESFDSGLPGITELGTADVRWEVWHPKLTRKVESKSMNWGVVGHLPSSLQRRLPWGTTVSAFYGKATNFRISPQRFTITGDALPSETGETTEYGVRVSTFHGKLDFRVGRYTTIADKASLGISGAIGALADMVGNVIDRNQAGDNANNLGGIQQFEAWLETAHGGIYRNAFSSALLPNTDPNRPAALYGRYAAATGDRGQITAVSALESTGVEMELVYNPTRNWRIAASAASAEAVRTNVAPELYDFIYNPAGGLLSLVQTPNGTPTAAGRLLGAPATDNTLRQYVYSNIINNGLVTAFAQEGTATDELRKWSFRAVTNYEFGREIFGGRLKGFSVGGALRWSDRALLGYAGKLIDSGGATQAISDVSAPYYGPRETSVDLSFAHSRKLTRAIDWKIQLTVKNVGVGNELRPLAVWPNGEVIQWTIREPQKWVLSNSLSF